MRALNKLPSRSFAIVGYGRVGRTLARGLVAARLHLCGIVIRREVADAWLKDQSIPTYRQIADLPLSVDFIFLCLRDAQIRRVAAEIAEWRGFRPGLIVAHTAGALSAEILTPVRQCGAGALAWHPLQTFTGNEGAELFAEITIGIDGDEAAISAGKELAAALGSKPVLVPPEMRAVYHLGGVFACNLIAALVGYSLDLLQTAGFDNVEARAALQPLLTATVRNISRRGLPDAVTGPLSRGDAATIRSHLKLLTSHPKAAAVYRLLSLDLLERLGDRLTPEQQAELRAVLSG